MKYTRAIVVLGWRFQGRIGRDGTMKLVIVPLWQLPVMQTATDINGATLEYELRRAPADVELGGCHGLNEWEENEQMMLRTDEIRIWQGEYQIN